MAVKWCRARSPWTLSGTRLPVMVECAPSSQTGLREVLRGVLDWVEERTGTRYRVERETSEVIGGRFRVYKYWAGPATRPVFEARIVEDPGKGLLWAGALLPGPPGLEALDPEAPGWEPSIEDPGPLARPPSAPRGQKVIRKPVVYAAEGRPEPREPVLELGYYTEQGPEPVAPVDIEKLHAQTLEADFHCVTGWSVSRVSWQGIPLRDLLADHGLRGKWIVAVSWGGYTTTVPQGWWIDESLLATGMNGSRLSLDHGWPARLVFPSLYGWKHAKWLRGIYVGDGYLDGFWEARGYHWRGLVALEERFKDLGQV